MFSRKTWDIQEFNKINLPEIVGTIENKIDFSSPNGIRVLDLPVYMPNQGLRFPDYIPFVYQDIVKMVIDNEYKYGGTDEHYIYITIDQKEVISGKTGRRAGAHSDAYIERDNRQIDITETSADIIEQETGEVAHTYVIYDVLPTEFFKAKFPLTYVDCERSLQTFNSIAEKSEVVTYPCYTLLKLDPYVVHRSAMCHQNTYRTFMKISVSKKQYARSGNTKNDLFDYDWSLKKRDSNVRNHPW